MLKKLSLALLMVATVATVSKAQSATQQLQLLVNGVNEISVVNNNVPLDSNLQTQPLGDFVVRSNNKAGYTVRVSSVNGSKLVNNTNDASIDYVLTSGAAQSVGQQGDGVVVSSVQLPQTPNSELFYTSLDFFAQNCVTNDGCRNGVTLTFVDGVPVDLVPADTYTDTITYTLVAL